MAAHEGSFGAAVTVGRRRKLMTTVVLTLVVGAFAAGIVVGVAKLLGFGSFFAFRGPGSVLGMTIAAALTCRLLLWWRYRPMELDAALRPELPTVTVVIPAYNEGQMVRRSIESVLASHYPADRVRVIVVDDGSKDETGAIIDRVAAVHPSRVQVIHLPRNRGKRHALYEGFSRARSVIVATVDSDSIVPPDSLANIVTPFLKDGRIGGVAGKVTAHNRRQNLLTRMLAVRYILGFDFVRAYQSRLRTVWCCPGALQAYRLSAIRPHLDRWRDQTFLGARCTNGDDHAMTNLVLSLGYDTTYQSNAPVETLVPTRYKALCKMYTRWGRSATREGLRALGFAWRRAHGLGPLVGSLMLVDALLQPLTIFARVVGVFAGGWLVYAHPTAILSGALLTTLAALFYAAIFLRSERSFDALLGVLYAWFAMLALPWIQPFATLTVRRNGWMTRG